MNFLSQEEEMYVKKRNGDNEIVSFDKILKRIKRIGQEANIKLNYTSLVMKVIDQLYDGISTTKIDELSAEQCATMSSIHPDYNILAGRIVVSNHHKNTNENFSTVMKQLYDFIDKHGKNSPIISDELYEVVREHGDELDNLCDYSRDYFIEYFGFKTLERSYLFKINRVVVERPQHMWLRVAIGIHGNNMERVRETYELMSCKYFTHATPTLFNAGTPHPQLSSCYLLSMENDSIEGIYNTLKDCALISKWAGGIGLHIHNVRASGSHIRGTNGSSNGIVPMLKVFNNTAKYVDQCIHPTTIIYTTDGPIQIQHCVSGVTKIFNKNGETEVIETVLEHSYSGEMIKIKSVSNKELVITPEHPIYVLKDAIKYDNNTLHNELKKGSMKFEWTEAKYVTTDDYIVNTIPTHTIDDGRLTERLCYLYGVFASLITKENKTTHFAFENIPDSHYDDILYFFNERIIEFKQVKVNNKVVFHVKRSVNFPFNTSDFYSDTTLRMHHRWLNLPINKTNAILSGYNSIISKDKTKCITEIEYLTLRSFMNTTEFAHMRDDMQESLFCFENNLLCPIKNISSGEHSGLLYDLQMKVEHNYLLANGIVHNGGGKRNGSFAIYLEPWHADIEMFLQMRKNHGDEELKARDLFYALWISDLFMERVKSEGKWTLFCPDECPGLADVYGDAFVELYTKYEASGKGRKTMNARDLWFQVLDAQMETGTPYLLYKDACNEKSNQKNVGTIKSSNLCTEIIEYSDENETAVCNLASIALPSFVQNGIFDYEKLHEVTKVVTYNLNRIIDVNFYPTPKTELSNLRHRPIGIGIQGLADVFMLMNLPFASDGAKEINRHIFETIYHASLEMSYEMALVDGPYSTFAGSPASQRILQFDMWKVTPSDRYDWNDLKDKIAEHGIRNSLLLAPMPTASTSQILGFNECIEPFTSNIYSRQTNAGEFIMANRYLVNDLLALDLWNEKMKNNIIANHGSIQHIEAIPLGIREKYRTVWEISMRTLIDMAADRGAFICQSQSLNLWLEDPNYKNLTAMHFYGWSKGLKTGIYYLRRRGRHQAQQFTIEPEKKGGHEEHEEICEMCSA
jgi:ribonucleoside-diphosphate reductase alpha subunit